MSKDKLVVIGNSVTIRVRPEDGSLTYPNIIANKLKLDLIHLGEGALLLEEFLNSKNIKKFLKIHMLLSISGL